MSFIIMPASYFHYHIFIPSKLSYRRFTVHSDITLIYLFFTFVRETWHSSAIELKDIKASLKHTVLYYKKHQTINLQKKKNGKRATPNERDRTSIFFVFLETTQPNVSSLPHRCLYTYPTPHPQPWSWISHVQHHTGKHSFEHTCACTNCSCKKESFTKNHQQTDNPRWILPEPSVRNISRSC